MSTICKIVVVIVVVVVAINVVWPVIGMIVAFTMPVRDPAYERDVLVFCARALVIAVMRIVAAILDRIM